MNKEWAENYLASFATKDLVVDTLWADDDKFQTENPITGETHYGKEIYREGFAPYANTDPDNGVGIHKFTLVEFFSGPNPAVYRWRWDCTGATSFLGLPTNGKDIVTTGVNTDWFDEDGKVIREVAYFDFLTPSIETGNLGYAVRDPLLAGGRLDDEETSGEG